MKKSSRAVLILILALATLGDVYGYEQPTHADMSEHALRESILASSDGPLSEFGMKPFDDATQKFPNQSGDPLSVIDLVRDGATQEDVGVRSLSHFYDPVYDRPLTVLGIVWGKKSPDWALEDQTTYSDQSYSLRDANEYLYNALTSAMPQDQNSSFGLLFETLGHVIHHIEDMAQPQHVRND